MNHSLHAVIAQTEQVILGKPQQIRLALACLLDYVQTILRHTRESARYVRGLSPRAGLSLLASARAWALLAGRDAVLPEDVQTVLPGIASHRLQSVQDLTSSPA